MIAFFENKINQYLLIFFIVSICFLISQVGNLSPLYLNFISSISLFCFILFIYKFINSSSLTTICFTIYPIFQISWVIASVFIIEQGFYISEQFIYGFPTGGTARLCFYSIIFFSSVKASMLVLKNANNKNFKSFYHNKLIDFSFAYLFGISILSLLIIYGIYNGFPLALSIDRFSYWDGGAVTQLFRRLTYMIPMIGFFIFFTGASSNIYGKLILFFCFPILFLFGDKFSGLLDVILYSLMGFIAHQLLLNSQQIFWSNILKVLILPLIIVALFAIYGYIVWHDTSEFGLFESILSRLFVLQGHVYYGIDNFVSLNTSNYEILDIFRKDSLNNPSGLPELMYVIAPDDFAYGMRENGIRFTMGGFAVILYKTSFFGAIPIIFLIGILTGLFFSIVIDQLIRKDLIGVLFSLIFFNSAYVNAFLMGEFYYLLKPIALLYYLFISFFYLLKTISQKLSKAQPQAS